MNKALFSSKTDQWATPKEFFDKLNAEFNFDLDPCADETNHKTPRYFTKEENGLLQEWGGDFVFFVIHHTEGISGNGLKNVSERATKIIQSLFFSFRPGLIRSISMILY